MYVDDSIGSIRAEPNLRRALDNKSPAMDNSTILCRRQSQGLIVCALDGESFHSIAQVPFRSTMLWSVAAPIVGQMTEFLLPARRIGDLDVPLWFESRCFRSRLGLPGRVRNRSPMAFPGEHTRAPIQKESFAVDEP